MPISSANDFAQSETMRTMGEYFARQYQNAGPARYSNRFFFGESRFERPDTPMTAKDCPVNSWKTSEGKKIKIVKLETPHLASIVALLLRNEKDGKKNPQRSKIISLKKELVKRLSE